uniref:THO complex subunit 3 n=1 Tax=Apteryx owenii TaxID=8824 RepID=A0A8B9PVM4_APTOW
MLAREPKSLLKVVVLQFCPGLHEEPWQLEAGEKPPLLPVLSAASTAARGSAGAYPELKPIQSINAHPSNCICIKFDPMGKYFATGSADALVSLWDVDELVCVRCFSRLDWPVRTLSFSHDGKMLASASEDHFIDIAEVETGDEKLWEVQCESPTFTVAWHPKRPLLAFACDDKDGKYDSSREAGTVKLFGLPNDS